MKYDKSEIDIESREKVLIYFVEKNLPQYKEMCEESIKNDAIILMHQDAYAGDYQDDEYFLLGAAIKYAGLRGVKEIRIIGKNGETIK